MVFESIVVDVLNRFLGDYVENLNRSQLKLGIWGGDVVLENLRLKQNALEELNIPVQTVYGHLGKLVLKIPWHNLYGASVEASVESLFLIVTPSAEVVYDPEKEEKLALAAKQAELIRVEEAKKKEAEKDQNKLDETFVEKLVTQIIKNVQLNIKDIHIRYEDSITNPKAPFSFGITLHNLSVHTTDENWHQTVIQDAVTKIFKILNLDGLAIYWNPATELYSRHEEQSIRERLSTEIATKSSQPTAYKYALGPINATAKLKLNPKPEADTPKFSLPKVILSLHMEQLSVNLSKNQYQDMMLLADSMDRMNKGAPFRKYRPNLRSYRGHYKEWWHFAFQCVLEDEVRRRRNNWDWTHMLSHRNLCKDYAKAYQCKLSNKGKATQEQQCVLDQAEKKLDLLNLVVIRQRIELEVERLGKLEAEARKTRGWFSGWWGGGNRDGELAEGTAISKLQVERLGKLEAEARKTRGWFSGWWGGGNRDGELAEGTAISKLQVERLGKLEAEARKTRGWFSGWWGGGNRDGELAEGTAISKLQVERLGKLEAEARKTRGWFSGWWGGGNRDGELAEGTAISKLQVERLGKLEAEARKTRGWFSGWWGGGNRDGELAEGTAISKLQVERLGKLEAEARKTRGWFSGWWGGGNRDGELAEGTAISKLQVERLGKLEAEARKTRGWFSGWWGGGNRDGELAEGTAISKLQVERLGKLEAEARKTRGWFSGWWGGGNRDGELAEGTAISKLQVERLGKLEAEARKTRGWFSGWWGGGNRDGELAEGTAISKLQVERLGKLEAEARKTRGWFSGWWGGGNRDGELAEGTAISKLQVERLGKLEAEARKTRGWFSGWWGGGNRDGELAEGTAISKLQVERLGKLEAEARKTRGWFSGWWGGGNRDGELAEGTAISKLQVERLGKLEAEARKTRGWFSGWWGGGNRDGELAEGTAISKLQVERLGKLEAEARKTRGWFSGWWGGGNRDGELAEGTAIMKQFQNAMTPEEKAKLFRAIDYQENSAPLHLPIEYVAVETCFRLDRLQVAVTDDKEVLKACVDNVVVEMGQRPSANAIRVDVQMQEFTVTGVQQGQYIPQLVTSKEVTSDVNLLNVMFETKPLDAKCDQRVRVSARPLQIIYDAQTVIEIVNVFKPETESSALTTLQAVAENKMADLKEKSALGMQYAVHQHTFIDLDIDIAASYIVVSKTGKFKPEEPCVVVKLGAISIKSEPRDETLDVKKLYKEGLADDQIIQEIARHSYDKLDLQLTKMQIVIALRDEDWQSAIASHEATPMHLLQPTNLVIQIHKCLITDDPRLPKIRIRGELQKIAISASEDRLLTLCEIIIGMPLPQAEESTQLKASESKGSSLSLLKYLDPGEKQKRDSARAKRKSDEQSVQLIEVEATFIMTELVLSVNRKKATSIQNYDKFLVFSLYMLELTATQKTFMLEATVRLGAVGMQHHRTGMKMIQMIDTPEVTERSEENTCHSLFAVTYSNVDKKCPDFRSVYGSVEQLIELDFATLRVLLHLEGLQEILVTINEYQTRLQNLQSAVDRVADAGQLETIVEDEEMSAVKSKTSVSKITRKKQVETIQLKVDVKIGAVEIEFATDKRRLSLVQLQKAACGLILKSSYTQVDCAISDINVRDLNPVTIHKDIIKVLGGDVMNAQVVMYNLEQGTSASDVNMSIEAQINCLRIVFLNWFVNSMLEFLNNFQTAQQAIIDASSQAVESARANVQNAYENSTKLALNIRLAAPFIVVPENSRSKKALLMDLGRMTLKNKFVDLTVEDVSNKVTVDELTLELEDVRLSCVRLVDDITAVKDENKLLKPTSLKLFVKRSLSSWYEPLPDLELSGRLKTISIRVGHSDYKSIMNILNQNLQEGQKKEVKSQTSVQKTTSKTSRSISKQDTRKVTTASVEPVKDIEVKKPRTTIKFAFTMDSLVIDLVNTNPTTVPGVPKDVELARLCLALFSVKGRMYSDNTINTSLLLVDCTLDDTRPDRGEKLTRYLERRQGSGDLVNITGGKREPLMECADKIRSMIDITYTMKNQDTYIDIRVFSFTLILAMDFLNKIADFMKTELEDLPSDSEHKSVENKALQVVNKVDKSDKPPEVPQTVVVKKKATPSVSHSTEQPQKLAMMTVNIKIEQPDILLVESLEQRTCDALVLNMEARFKLRKNEERMVADGGISGLQMVIRTLGKEEKNPLYLLEPTNMSFAMSQPPNYGMHVDVAISDIKITVSPHIIGLLNRVIMTMTSTEEDDTQQADKIIQYSQLWDIAPFKPNTYWFLKTEIAEEAMDLEEILEADEKVKPPVDEICLLSSPSIVFSLEMQIGTETIPVLVMQASLTCQLKDWSSEFYLESIWAMQVSYYNLGRAVWEPLIEPVEVLKDYTYKHVPWELKMEVVMRSAVDQNTIDLTDEAANAALVAQRQANKTITISSHETLEITVTRSGMEVLTLLGNSFSAAIADTSDQSFLARKNETEDSKSEYNGAPYVLHNCTGLTAKLVLEDNHDFTVFLADGKKKSDYREVVFETGACVPLNLKRGGLNVMKLNEAPPPLSLSVRIIEIEEKVVVPVERADKRYFPLGRKQAGAADRTAPHVFLHESRGLISDVVMQDAALHIYLRSVLQVTNNLSENVTVYYMTLSGNEVRSLGEVKPGATLRLPLQAVHTPTAEIFFSVEGFTVSVSPFVWRELQQEVRIAKLLQCDSKDKSSGEKFYINAVGTMEQVFFENTNRHTFASSCYDIVLKPSVKLQNCLPVDVVVSQLGLNRTQTFKPGEMFHLSHLAPNKASIVIMIENYLEKCWVCTKNLPDNETELSVWSFQSHDSPSVMTLDLGMHSVESEGSQVMSLYCPFWMLNKTGLTLCYRNVDETGNVIFHPKEYKEPIMFSFRAKNFFGKKKAAIRIDFGEWSEKFSLDVPGSSGVITCKFEGRSYQVAVTNQLSFNSLTKMVIFTPFFLIINEAAFGIEYQELHRSADPWQEVEKNSSAPLWPVVEKDEKLLILRVGGTKEITAPFLYTEQHSSCLKLTNEYGGIHVEVQCNEGGTYITVRQYRDGHAPALLINYCPYEVTVYEKENVNNKKIPPMEKMLYTWDNPAGPRVLIFAAHNKKEIENDLRQDGIGEFMVDGDHTVWWVSFLDGLQRVVLFTEDAMLASGAHTVGEAELVDTEVVFAVHGVGLSLVNDPQHLELIYMTISNSGTIWEQCKLGARRYKKIEGHKLKQYEEAYQKYLVNKLSPEPTSPVCRVDDKIEVNFEEMRQTKPNARLLRRTLEPGLWASIGMTAHSRRLHARLHRLQIDQQLPLPTFPVTLAPVPPPPSVANLSNSGMKPFIEVSIVERIMEHTKVRQYKYYKVLIQEFHVKADMGLINALLGMFPQRLLTEQEALEAFQTDLENARQPLEALAAIGAASDIKNFYDNLHLSPLKVHVSFSLGGATQLPSFIGTVLQSIGVTLTDMNDVVFKLSYYERNFEFLSQKELISQVSSHYQGQAIKQLYVLVLGLDVIGNPYGLVVGFKKGVEDLFYEPFQGAIQGPGEFAEGLFLGVRSLVGHTVGGAAGAMSRITGAMGHGLAALSLDKDYQRRRRDNINKPPANLQEGLARSGKGLVMGVYDGVTGVFTKPLEGARSEGVEGFFKGLGRGAVGLVARPTAGVVDFAAGSFDAVKRAADLSEETTKRRATRYLPPDTGVRPYSRSHAEGYKMLFELEKGKYVATDSYEAHVWVIPSKEVVMCTDKRLLYLEKNVVFGGWQIVWTYLWSEIPEVPTSVNKGVYIPTTKRKVLGLFPTTGSGKVIFLVDEKQKKYLLAQCERLMSSR